MGVMAPLVCMEEEYTFEMTTIPKHTLKNFKKMSHDELRNYIEQTGKMDTLAEAHQQAKQYYYNTYKKSFKSFFFPGRRKFAENFSGSCATPQSVRRRQSDPDRLTTRQKVAAYIESERLAEERERLASTITQ